MKIELNNSFSDRFEKQLRFIAKDSPMRAKVFKANVIKEISCLIDMPFRCRKSIYFDDENIRDLIFKGYVIVYRVQLKTDKIEIFGFTKYQNSPAD